MYILKYSQFLFHYKKPTSPPSNLLIQIITMTQSHQNKFSDDPFIIVYNCRKSSKDITSPKRIKRQSHDYSLAPHSIIMTRKMVAQLEQRRLAEGQPSEDPIEGYEEELALPRQLEDHSHKFFSQGELQKGIPLPDYENEDILYNLNEVSRTSNYSKLQRTLLGLSFQQTSQMQQMDVEVGLCPSTSIDQMEILE